MSSDYNFQTELENSINNADPKLDKKELLIDIFKIYVAKLFEIALNKSKTKDRIPYDALVEIKRNLISEFRAASLEMNQLSVEQYEELFESTVQEILNDAGNAHKGEDSMNIQSHLDINRRAYRNEFKRSPGGIIIPN